MLKSRHVDGRTACRGSAPYSRRARSGRRGAAFQSGRVGRGRRHGMGGRTGTAFTRRSPRSRSDDQLGDRADRDSEGTRTATCASNCILKRVPSFAAPHSGTKSDVQDWATSSSLRFRLPSIESATPQNPTRHGRYAGGSPADPQGDHSTVLLMTRLRTPTSHLGQGNIMSLPHTNIVMTAESARAI